MIQCGSPLLFGLGRIFIRSLRGTKVSRNEKPAALAKRQLSECCVASKRHGTKQRSDIHVGLELARLSSDCFGGDGIL